MKYYFLSIIAIALLLTSCASPKYSGTPYGENIPTFLHDTVEYRIQPGDQLTVQSFNNLSSVIIENSMTGASSSRQGQVPEFQVWVEEDGEVVLPKAGRINAQGLTEEEAAQAVEQAYAGTINDPAFYVNVSNRMVKVLGAVYNQGMYPMTRENQTLGEVLSLAGGVNFEQLGKQLILIRNGIGADSASASKPMLFDLDIHNLADPALTNIVIHSNDVVYLPPSRATVSAAKFRNISAFIQPVLLVLNSIILINTLAK
ncbi:protein involved in polysaccharide export with SLBB domain [Anseongella ginsenosidimutans]|uniref:Protein involved in polysaccharide export with SLBB domain n=1 Tax=Anseongella ginsenosidimutans TaxID=496056 RepID=A0A4R3KM71_9SPHI|nr:polysaccharide biosynthesis/export family protein [Anseongella ginsenosidimutans]QEC52124.1 hypothetical protein FRZ59_07105 [Anseongella ginsenosidimutans]TCS84847.1 protein involved in polysaccharide export with SLBB domain [Anseongella ginsenosidimutans]